VEAAGAEDVFNADLEGRGRADIGLLDAGGGGALRESLRRERGVTLRGEGEGLRQRERGRLGPNGGGEQQQRQEARELNGKRRHNETKSDDGNTG
jgi:hypothetical protein